MRGRKTEILQIHYVFRVFRFLSPTKLNRYEQAVYSAAHTIQPLCLRERRNFIPYAPFEALKVRDLGSSRCNVIAIMKISVKIWSNQHIFTILCPECPVFYLIIYVIRALQCTPRFGWHCSLHPYGYCRLHTRCGSC